MTASADKNEGLHLYQRYLLEHLDDPGNLQAIIESVDGFVHMTAFKTAGRHHLTEDDTQDLISEGRLSVIDSARKFDPTFEVHFLSYASVGIKRAMDRWVFAHQTPASGGMHMCGGSERGKEALNTFSGETLERLRVRIFGGDHPSINAERPGLRSFAETMGDGVDIEALLSNTEFFAAAMEKLNERERFIARGRLNDRTLQEIGDELGITRERVRQLEAKAAAKIAKFVDREDRRCNPRRAFVGAYSLNAAHGWSK